MGFKRVEDLDIYRLAELISDRLWDIVYSWPKLAQDTLGSQSIRAADSIGANIAEGAGRGSAADNRRYLRIARGSLLELRFWLRRAYHRKLLSNDDTQILKDQLDRLAPMLNAYIRSFTRGISNNKNQLKLAKHETQNTNHETS